MIQPCCLHLTCLPFVQSSISGWNSLSLTTMTQWLDKRMTRNMILQPRRHPTIADSHNSVAIDTTQQNWNPSNILLCNKIETPVQIISQTSPNWYTCELETYSSFIIGVLEMTVPMFYLHLRMKCHISNNNPPHERNKLYAMSKSIHGIQRQKARRK